MLTSLLRFEVEYHFKQITFRMAAASFFGLGMLMTFGNFGGDDVSPNAPYVTGFIVCLLSLFSLFVTTLACASVVLRDVQYQMEPLVFTTSVGRLPYFMARLGGLLGAVAFVMLMAAAGIALGPLLGSAKLLAPFRISHYLLPFAIFALPSIIFCSSIVFTTALLTRNVRYVYAVGVLLFILYFTASILGNSPVMASSTHSPGGPGWLSVLLDPFGLTAFFGETANWPVWRRNTELFPLTPAFLSNRLFWTGLSLGLLTLAYRRFQFRVLIENNSKTKAAAPQPPITTAYRTFKTFTTGFNYQIQTFSKILHLETKALLGHVLTLVLLALWVFFTTVELSENLTSGPYGVRSYATSGMLAEQLLTVRPALLLLIFFASEMVHRERNTGMHALIFATPVSKTTFAIAKSSALLIWILMLMTVHILAGIAFQYLAGVKEFQWNLYFSLYYYAGLPLMLYAVLIIFIQIIFQNKYLGMFLSGVVIGLFLFGRKLGLESYLVRFAVTPPLQYSDMHGFGHDGLAFDGYMLYWASFALVLGIMGARLWVDGMHDTWASHVRESLRNWGRPAVAIALSGSMLCAGTGFYIHSQTGHSAYNRNGGTDPEWQAKYERKYKRLENMAQPVITAINIQTDLYPDGHYYTVKGSYRVTNKSGKEIRQLWFGVDPDVELTTLQPENAEPVWSDNVFHEYPFHLQKPLAPGADMTIRFAIRVERPPYKSFNSENSVAENGTYIELEKYLPHLGYMANYEITDPRQRQKYNLPERISIPSSDSTYHFIDFQNLISTDSDQQVVTTGTLHKTWLAGKRRYFQYKSAQPIPFMFALSSARYALRTDQYQGTTFRIYYHPGHEANVPAMMLAMKDALDYGNTHFSPYPLRELTLAEIPHYPGSATAYPGVIFSHERINFTTDFSDSTRFNFTYATTAHETAHQWWAGRVSASSGPGYALLTESLAKYTEAMVTEKRFGKSYLRPYHLADKQLYFALRNANGEIELPLWMAQEQPFVHYQKGGLALYHLKEALGEEHITKALQQLIAQHGYPRSKPRPTDLVETLKTDATPAQVRLIDELFKKVIIYDNDFKILSNKALPNKKYQLILQVNIHKTDETTGKPVPMQPNDEVEIAIFDREIVAGKRLPEPVYLQKHQFSRSSTTISIITSKRPVAVVLDPMAFMLDD
ncbi:ABC transporter permease [Dyadobacter sp. CY261]|uniref:M1 family aminopeptidase n=1 Tax=Dyadobacter sp. CY261 TaxID=2907203 RepID=UPI001F194287|nr:M1 family aminopeptidase [Dyadobacter sp. CY261]MCF0074371.1 ABC transporter permease [Dyadobacter sp. CY261]